MECNDQRKVESRHDAVVEMIGQGGPVEDRHAMRLKGCRAEFVSECKQNKAGQALPSTLLSAPTRQTRTSIIHVADISHVCSRGPAAFNCIGTAWHQLCYRQPTGQGRLRNLLQGGAPRQRAAHRPLGCSQDCQVQDGACETSTEGASPPPSSTSDGIVVSDRCPSLSPNYKSIPSCPILTL